MSNPKILIALIVGLVLVLLATAAGTGAITGGQAAGLVGVAMMLTLLWPFVTRQFIESPGGALRDILIWAAILVLVAVIYASKGKFGF